MNRSEARSRAEHVRRRRRDQVSKRLTNSAVMATRIVTPVTARARSLPIPIQGARPAVRRRSEVAISMPGIQVQLPTISFSGPGAKWRFVSFGLALLLGAALYMAGTAAAFSTAPIQVSGNQRIATEEINAALGVTGRQIFTLVPSEIERTLRLNFPDISAARVEVSLPNQVYVDLVERVPVVEWHQGEGYTWIDDSGVAFRPRGAAEGIIAVQAQDTPKAVSLAALDPLAPMPFVSPDLVAAVKALAPHAPAGSVILYDSRYGLGWADSRGWQVYFGDQSRDMPLKLQVYDAMVQMVSTKGIRPAFMSVQYPTAPYYRMTQ